MRNNVMYYVASKPGWRDGGMEGGMEGLMVLSDLHIIGITETLAE